MGKKNTKYPPLENNVTLLKQRLLRWTLNVFVLIGAAVLCYLLFSFFFDTPAEYKIKQQTALLREEYRALSERFAEVETIMDNVEERDLNVFQILFEAKPFDLAGGEASRLALTEQLYKLTNNELKAMLISKSDDLATSLIRTSETYAHLFRLNEELGDKARNIPSIQPIINNELLFLTASFGMRIHPFYKMLMPHNGVDFTVPEGSRVFATADGRVKETILRRSTSGLSVVIDHGNDYETTYSHLSIVSVKKGQQVRRGDIIALTGNTGLSLVPHLHYEVRYKGEFVDPVNYFYSELTPSDYQRLIRIARTGMQSFD